MFTFSHFSSNKEANLCKTVKNSQQMVEDNQFLIIFARDMFYTL